MKNKSNAIGCLGLFIIVALISQGLEKCGCASPPPKLPSQTEHTCSYCGDTFKGNGWSSITGEQYQPSDGSGIYCSKKCAYESQPRKWK